MSLKRAISKAQAKKLAAVFHLPADLFRRFGRPDPVGRRKRFRNSCSLWWRRVEPLLLRIAAGSAALATRGAAMVFAPIASALGARYRQRESEFFDGKFLRCRGGCLRMDTGCDAIAEFTGDGFQVAPAGGRMEREAMRYT